MAQRYSWNKFSIQVQHFTPTDSLKMPRRVTYFVDFYVFSAFSAIV